jgi:hypothetical protein
MASEGATQKKLRIEDGPSDARPNAENRISIHGSGEAGESFKWCVIVTSQHPGNFYGNLVRGITRDRMDRFYTADILFEIFLKMKI